MANVGRKAKFEASEYIDAVKKCRSLNDKDVALVLGVDLTTVYRFRKNSNNWSIISEAEKALEEIKIVRYDGVNNSIDIFRLNPSIIEWVNMQRKVSEDVKSDRVNVMFNVCKYFGVNPDKLTVEACAKLVNEMKERYDKKEPAIRGLAYYYIRKPIRIWFMLTKKMSAQYLTNMGIDADRSKGTGTMATERIPRDIRHRLNGEYGDNLKVSVMKYSTDIKENVDVDKVVDEMHGIAYFMYYTATRITATSNVILNDPQSKYETDIWRIHLIDKGRKGGLHWIKLFYGHGLEAMRDYIEKRFGLPKEIQDATLPTMDKYMFPWTHDNYRTETKMMKYAEKISGLQTRIPNHIYRHTFAQDGLDATDNNYDLVAELGGWEDTGTMKRSYGKRSQKSRESGLRKMLGYKEKDETYELRW